MKIILACELDPATTRELMDIPGVVKVEPRRDKVLKELPADVLITKIGFEIDREILEKVKHAVKATVGLDNVVLTPHIGAYTAEAQRRVGEEVVGIVRGILSEQVG